MNEIVQCSDDSSYNYFTCRKDRNNEQLGSRIRKTYTKNANLTKTLKKKEYIGNRGLLWILEQCCQIDDFVFTYKNYPIDDQHIIYSVIHKYRNYNGIGELTLQDNGDVRITEIGRLIGNVIYLHKTPIEFHSRSPLKSWTDYIFDKTGGHRNKLTVRNVNTGWNYVCPFKLYDNLILSYTLLEIKKTLLLSKSEIKKVEEEPIIEDDEDEIDIKNGTMMDIFVS